MKRDEYLSKSVEALSDRLLPFSITCNNSLITSTIDKMKTKFLEQRLLLEKIKKTNQFSADNKGKILTEQ